MIAYSTRTAAKTAAIMAAAIMAIGGTAPVCAQDGAQNGTTEQLLACDGMINPAERLACFNAVVEGLQQSPAAPAASSPSALAPASVSAPPAARPTTTASPVAPSVAVAPEPAAADASSLSVDTPVAPTATSTTEVDDLGRDNMTAETVRQENEEQENEEKKKDAEVIQATIVRSWRNHDERFSVELDNGQVWRETPGKTRYGLLPKEGRSVKIYVGGLGGYRMKVDGIPRVAWVRRTK